MNQHGRYRHELKYYISYADYLAIRQRVRPVMTLDRNTGTDGKYRIRNVYFDNYRDKALREKIDGLDRREKFRIRYYNNDLSFITLEKKMKVNGLCMKINAPLTLEECRKLLDGDTDWMMSSPEPLIQELYVKMKSELLVPRVIVSYTREPYVYAPGNVRVTFDSDIRTGLYNMQFLEPEAKNISAMEDASHMILEVKYDDFLPGIIEDIIQTDSCRQQAFSKYGASRRFG